MEEQGDLAQMCRAVDQRVDGRKDRLGQRCDAQPLERVYVHEQREEVEDFGCGVETAYGHGGDRRTRSDASELQVARHGKRYGTAPQMRAIEVEPLESERTDPVKKGKRPR